MPTLDPHSVNDLESFLAFVLALAADRRASVEAEQIAPSSPYGPDAFGWENTTIETFLEGAYDWAKTTKMGVTQGLPAEPSWRAFAVFLNCGASYE
jgi:hypothetical protein